MMGSEEKFVKKNKTELHLKIKLDMKFLPDVPAR
jgi:hypothetical protein